MANTLAILPKRTITCIPYFIHLRIQSNMQPAPAPRSPDLSLTAAQLSSILIKYLYDLSGPQTFNPKLFSSAEFLCTTVRDFITLIHALHRKEKQNIIWSKRLPITPYFVGETGEVEADFCAYVGWPFFANSRRSSLKDSATVSG